MNPQSLAVFHLSPQVISLAQKIFELTLFIETIEPIVIGYEKALFRNHHWYADPSTNLNTQVRLTNRKQVCLMSKEDVQLYFSLLNQSRIASGLFTHDEDICPLTAAESRLYRLQSTLIESMSQFTSLSSYRVVDRQSYVDFLMSLLAPYLIPTFQSNEWKWRFGATAKTIEDARNIVSIIVEELGLTISSWKPSLTAISPWEYAQLSDSSEHVITVGISAGGVVSVNGDPFTPIARQSNITLSFAYESISSAFSRLNASDAFWLQHQNDQSQQLSSQHSSTATANANHH